MLRSLRDLRGQHARLILHSSGYRAWECRLDKRQWLKHKWNRIASTFSHIVTSKVGVASEGHDIISQWPNVPRFLIPSIHLNQFLDWLRNPEFDLATGV